MLLFHNISLATNEQEKNIYSVAHLKWHSVCIEQTAQYETYVLDLHTAQDLL